MSAPCDGQSREQTINLKQLRFFVKVVEVGNITRAAERLHLAQTALGQQLRQLEDSLGVQLFVRHSRGITLTQPGEVLYKHAISILQSVNAARRDVIASNGPPTEKINLGVTPSVLNLIGADLLELARAELPQINLQLVEELSFNLTDSLRRGDLDIVIASDTNETLDATPLLEEELLFISGAYKHRSAEPISFHEAISTDLALVGERDVPWQIVHATAERLSMRVNVVFKVQSMPAIKALVSRGAATSIMPYGVVAEEIKLGTLHARRIVEPQVRRTLYFSRASGRAPFFYEQDLMRFLDGIVQGLLDRTQPYGSRLGNGLEQAMERSHNILEGEDN